MIAELEDAVALTAPSDAPFSGKGTFAAILENAGVSVDFDDRLNTPEDLPMKLLTEDLVALLPRHLERYLENTHPGKFQFALLEDLDVECEFGLAWKRHNKKHGLKDYAHIFTESFNSLTIA